jgi:hypothetical protein
MPDTSLQAALRAFVSEDEPPMGLTSGEVLATGRRLRRRYRLAAVGGATVAVALAVTGAVVVPQSLRPAQPTFAALARCPSPPGDRPAGTVDAAQPFSAPMAAWAVDSVTCALADVVPRLLPHARFAALPGGQAGPLVGYTLGGKPPWANRADAIALVHDRYGTGYLNVSVAVSSAADAQAAATSCEQNPPCTVRQPGPGITLVVSETVPASPRDPHLIGVDVYHGRTDVHVQLDNTDMQSADGKPPRPTRDQPVLTTDQAADLALSPGLYLFP